MSFLLQTALPALLKMRVTEEKKGPERSRREKRNESKFVCRDEDVYL